MRQGKRKKQLFAFKIIVVILKKIMKDEIFDSCAFGLFDVI